MKETKYFDKYIVGFDIYGDVPFEIEVTAQDTFTAVMNATFAYIKEHNCVDPLRDYTCNYLDKIAFVKKINDDLPF